MMSEDDILLDIAVSEIIDICNMNESEDEAMSDILSNHHISEKEAFEYIDKYFYIQEKTEGNN